MQLLPFPRISNTKARQPGSPSEMDELFEKAVRDHSPRLLTIARAIAGYRASPEDIVQQALLNLYTHRARYDWNNPAGLMRQTVVNEALRILRQPKIAPFIEDHPDQNSSPVSDLIENETVLQVRRAIDRLPENFRAALILCEYENLSYAEIAQALSASIPQVKTWIHRGRRQLEQLLRDFVETGKPVK